MARKLRGLERVLDAPSLFAIAYGEIASSLYIALGIVAAAALGLTPLVLLLTGAVFVLVALSYAEGVTALPETGGAATFVRRAFNDLAGFVTGWVLFLDFLIVMALSALFVPHYLAGAVGMEELREAPWDAVVACGLIVVIAGVRIARRTRLHVGSLAVAVLDLFVQGILVLLGLALLLSPETLTEGLGFASGQEWSDLAFALPLAMLAYTGLETVANLAEETREPGRALPRSLFSAIGLVVVVTVLIGAIGLSAYPVSNGETELGEEWLEAPLVGIAAAFDGSLPSMLVDALEVAVAISGVLILVGATTTSFSGITRLTRSLAEHGSLPRELARLERRSVVSSETIAIAAALAVALLVATEIVAGGDPAFLASLYSFGVLIAFTAAQLAVIRLRFTEPDLARPYRVPGNIRVRGVAVPVAALVGAPLTFALWIAALYTHDAARIAGPIWLVLGAVLFVAVRKARHQAVMEHVEPALADLVPEEEGVYERILVPVKLGQIGEEMLATAIRLAEERGCSVRAVHVIKVPLELPLDAELTDEEEKAEASLAEAKLLAAEHGVEVEGEIVRGRAIGEAIVDQATGNGVDLILLGSAPRWRRQSRFFSPTVDYVLRRAPCEVMVVTYPQGVLEE